MSSSAGYGMDSTFARIEARLNLLIVLAGGLYVVLLPSLWLLVRIADKLGALEP